MAGFKLSENRNKNKVFLLNRTELEKRFDPFYYIPELTELEKKVSRLNPEKLRHYVLSIGSGATPKTTESEKYYSDKENGIPFLRVQNLSPTGILEFDDCKYINHETHNNYLKRSQVKEGDLLVKITGVGRMAVSSIAPDGFIGNTNQHMVVIRTGDKKISEIIAAYLNTDIGDKLASRRATGGTRPALDYSALLSMQVVYDEKILEISKNAVNKKQELENQAQQLLASIDDYLLKELGIKLPEQTYYADANDFKGVLESKAEYEHNIRHNDFELDKQNKLVQKRQIFLTYFVELSSRRFDSDFYSEKYLTIQMALRKSKYNLIKIKEKCKFQAGYAFSSNDYLEFSNCHLVTIKNISENIIDLSNSTFLPDEFYNRYRNFQIKKNDLLIAMTGATIGKVGIFDSSKKALINQRNGIIKSDKLNTFFLMNLLNTEIYQNLILRNSVGGAQPNISETDIIKIKIPLPPLEKQNEIAEHIKGLRNKAKRLQEEAKQEMENAKREIEKMILN